MNIKWTKPRAFVALAVFVFCSLMAISSITSAQTFRDKPNGPGVGEPIPATVEGAEMQLKSGEYSPLTSAPVTQVDTSNYDQIATVTWTETFCSDLISDPTTDNGNISQAIGFENMPPGTVINDLDIVVDLDPAHTWLGDLAIGFDTASCGAAGSVAGCASIIFDGDGGDGGPSAGGSGDDIGGAPITFDDTGTGTYAGDLADDGIINNSTGNLPEGAAGALTQWEGTSPEDMLYWITLADDAGGDGGTLEGWCMTMELTAPEPDCATSFNSASTPACPTIETADIDGNGGSVTGGTLTVTNSWTMTNTGMIDYGYPVDDFFGTGVGFPNDSSLQASGCDTAQYDPAQGTFVAGTCDVTVAAPAIPACGVTSVDIGGWAATDVAFDYGVTPTYYINDGITGAALAVPVTGGASAFAASCNATGAATAAISCPVTQNAGCALPPESLSITEVLFDSCDGDDDAEFTVVCNDGATTVNLDGWGVGDGASPGSIDDTVDEAAGDCDGGVGAAGSCDLPAGQCVILTSSATELEHDHWEPAFGIIGAGMCGDGVDQGSASWPAPYNTYNVIEMGNYFDAVINNGGDIVVLFDSTGQPNSCVSYGNGSGSTCAGVFDGTTNPMLGYQSNDACLGLSDDDDYGGITFGFDTCGENYLGMCELDLNATKEASPAMADPGDTITFTITISNPTNITANMVNGGQAMITDTFSADLTGVTCDTGTVAGNQLTATLDVAPGETTITCTATIADTLMCADVNIANSVDVGYTTLDWTYVGSGVGNNDSTYPTCAEIAESATASSSAVTATGMCVDVMADVAVDKSSVVSGNMVMYTIDITNTGTAPGTINFTDTLPAGFAGSCSFVAGSQSLTNSTALDVNDGIGTTCSQIDLSGLPAGKTVGNVSVDLSMAHSWIGDLTVVLNSPTGTSVDLIPASLSDSSDLDGTTLTFSDSGTNDPATMGATIGGADFVCTDDGECDFFPGNGNFSDFNGDLATGFWELCATDSAGGDDGQILSWTLNFDSMIPVPVMGGVVEGSVDLDAGAGAQLMCTGIVDGGLDISKELDDPDGIVNVNQPHSFTVTITNTASTTMTNIALVDTPVAGCPGALTPAAPTDLAPGAVYVGTCMAPGVPVTYTNFITATGDVELVNTVEATVSGTMNTATDTVTDTVTSMDSDSELVRVINPTYVTFGSANASSAQMLRTVLLTTAFPILVLMTFMLVRRRRFER